MSCLHITGGARLEGSVQASGSKNAALPMMAAAILASEPVRLEGVPRLADVDTMARVLARLGLEAAWTGDHELRLETIDPGPVRAPYELVRQMRAGFCVLGPLLARRGRAMVSLPGGCAIGPRPVDLHLTGLAALGASLRIRHGYVLGTARRLAGARIHLSGPNGPTVTGTANVLSAAVLARGETILTGAAVEPEIVDLGELLSRLGARIEGLGTSTLRIVGVGELGGAVHRVIPDRIEAATLLLAAAITRGQVSVTGVVPRHLDAVLDLLNAAGFALDVSSDRIALTAHAPPRPLDVAATAYPGVPTDLQAQWTALLCLARGRSTVCDRVFPSRFLHVAELNRLGARIEVHGSTAVIHGVRRLRGAAVTATDLRASAAMVLAGLAARGQTTLRDAHHLDRGYEALDGKLSRLGARVDRALRAVL